MKKYLFFLLLYFSYDLFGQHVVNLSIKQPPEFGFSVSKHDTSILKDSSVILGNDITVYGGSGSYRYKWSPGKSLSDSSILHPIASPKDTTVYLLTVTDKNGCSFSIAYTVNVKTLITKSDLVGARQDFFAVLFPNPNKGNFKVKLTGKPTKRIELTVYDITGKVMERRTINDFSGDHTETLQIHLVSGVYTLRINLETETLSCQFIIN